MAGGREPQPPSKASAKQAATPTQRRRMVVPRRWDAQGSGNADRVAVIRYGEPLEGHDADAVGEEGHRTVAQHEVGPSGMTAAEVDPAAVVGRYGGLGIEHESRVREDVLTGVPVAPGPAAAVFQELRGRVGQVAAVAFTGKQGVAGPVGDLEAAD